MVGDDTENDFRRCVQKSSFSVEQGHTSVHLGQNGIPDGLGLGADNFHFRLAGAHEHHPIQGEGQNQNQQNAVEQILQGMKQQLGNHNAEIKYPQAGRNRDMQILFQNQRWDIHTTGRSAASDHHAQRYAQPQRGKNHIQQNILGNPDIPQGAIEHLQGGGIKQRRKHRAQGKLPADHPPAHQKHHHIEHENKAGDGDMGQMIDHQSNAGGSAADQVRRQQKQLNRQCIQNVACHHQQQGKHPISINFL